MLSDYEQALLQAIKDTQLVLVAAMMCAQQVGNHTLHDQAKAAYERNDELVLEAR